MSGYERLTAADAEGRQRRAAAGLAGRGLAAGDRVGVVAGSCADLLCVVLGALRTGVVPVVLNPALLPAERDALLADADVALTLDDAGVAALAAGEGVGAGGAGTTAAIERATAAAAAAVELAPWPLARPMHYTSGTTGTPKGVWSGVLDPAGAEALAAEERELWGFDAADTHLVCSPLHHSAPIRFSGGTLAAGGDVVVLRRFDPAVAAAAITAERPTTAFLVPAHLQRLFAAGDAGGGLPDLSGFRLVAHAGAHCPEPLKRRALAAFPAGAVWEFYGSTEGQFPACGPDDWLAHPGTVGRARPHRRLRVDEGGQVWCAAPPWARFTYWRDPAKTAAAWRGDEFTVGDLGRLDADGFLYLDGRRDDLIITGGVNVYPAEVERALHAMPGVEDVAVFGVADDRWGQRVTAAVVGDVSPEAVASWARAHLAPYKRPKQVVPVADIPLGPTGKVRRSHLATDLGIA